MSHHYQPVSQTRIAVHKNGELVGHIRVLPPHRGGTQQGYQFVPVGKRRGGEIYISLEACKDSIEKFPPSFIDALRLHQFRRP